MTEEVELSEVESVGSEPQEAELEEVASLETTEPEAQAAEVAESEEEDSDATEGKVPDKVQQRFNKMTREKYELRGQIEEMQKQLEDIQKQSKTETKEPSLEDFNYDQDKYKAALVDYGKSLATQKQTTTEPQVDTVKAEKVAAFGQRLSEFRKDKPDYADVVSQMPISQIGSDAILEMENGPAVAYYLGNHLDLVEEINDLSPAAAALRIADLSRKLKPAEPKISTAPDPVSSVTSGGGKVTKNTDDMTVEELAAYDEQQWRLQHG